MTSVEDFLDHDKAMCWLALNRNPAGILRAAEILQNARRNHAQHQRASDHRR